MTTAYDLLARGYFPKELPPPFSTLDFANKVFGSLVPLPESFTNKKKIRAHACMHNLARSGTLRRRIAICNPVVHYNLCTVMEKAWPRLERLAGNSPFSASRPTADSVRACVAPKINRATLRPQHRATARFLLKADVARFYHSIYTHSIPWAIHGKRRAKQNRSDRLLGNLIDQWIRNGQDGQTMGIPIGPDTSLVISEVILSAVDRAVKRQHKRIRGFRYMDDYELSTSTRQHAEVALSILQAALAEYEIALNAEKTTIEEIPTALDQAWVAPIRDFSIAQKGSRQATNLLAFFDLAFSLTKTYRGRNVLPYAISRLRSTTVQTENWGLFQDLLLQSILAEPGTAVPVLDHLRRYHDAGYELDRAALADVLNIQIAYQAPLGHDSEVAWALWAILVFEIDIKRTAAEVLSRTTDSVVALLALDARNKGLINRGLDTELWASSLTKDDLYNDQWLLSYEAGIKGWLGKGDTTAHIREDSNFSWLHSVGVEFYDLGRTDPLPLPSPDSATPGLSITRDLENAIRAVLHPYGGDTTDDEPGYEFDQFLDDGFNNVEGIGEDGPKSSIDGTSADF